MPPSGALRWVGPFLSGCATGWLSVSWERSKHVKVFPVKACYEHDRRLGCLRCQRFYDPGPHCLWHDCRAGSCPNQGYKTLFLVQRSTQAGPRRELWRRLRLLCTPSWWRRPKLLPMSQLSFVYGEQGHGLFSNACVKQLLASQR